MQELALEALQRWHQALARAMAASHGPAFAGALVDALASLVPVESVMINLERSGDAPGHVNHRDVSDLIVALNNVAGLALASDQPHLTGDGGVAGAVDCTANRQTSVAYWIVVPLKDRSGDGERLDPPQTSAGPCVFSPGTPVSATNDDVVLSESPTQLAGWLRKSLP